HDGHPTSTTRGREGVLMRAGGVVVDELRDHREVTRDLFCILLAESLQLVACRGMQVACGDLVRQRRLGNTLTHRSELVDRAVDATARPVAERTAGTLVAIL